jgi:outer membrane protein assembly factor BamB
MRLTREYTKAFILLGLAAVLESGCSPGGMTGASITPAGVAQSAQSANAEPAGVAAAGKTAQWLQFGYDSSHSGYNPIEKTIGTKNVSNLQIAWNDQSIIQPGGIVVDHNVAYVEDMGQSNEGLYALDAVTGAQKWHADVHLNGGWGGFTHAAAAVVGNVVVSPCSNNSSSAFLTGLCGVNAKTGKVLWKTYCTEYQGSPCGGLTNEGTSPTLYGNLIYFQSVQGVNEQPDTQALNPKTGKIVWDVPGVYHCPDAGDTSDNPIPAANGKVFAVMGCGGSQGATEICAFSAASGSAAWCDASPTAYIQELIAGNGNLYVAEPGASGGSGAIVALNAATGTQVWTKSLPAQNYVALATANNRVFVEDGSAGVYALSSANGKSLWSYTANANLFHAGVLSVANGVVYADGGGGNNGNVAISAFNEKNGKLIWTSGTIGNGGANATPVIVNGKLYAGCYTVCAFTLSSKK